LLSIPQDNKNFARKFSYRDLPDEGCSPRWVKALWKWPPGKNLNSFSRQPFPEAMHKRLR
jgi:hypothetical protein